MLLRHRAERGLAERGLKVRPGYFDELYAAADDPWDLAQRFYERRKRALLLASLPRERFTRAFEPGCALGLVTRALAQCCDEVVATDVADRAVALARRRTADLPGVTVRKAAFPEDRPIGTYDLIVLSEVGYYCTDLPALRAAVGDILSADGVLVGCHWRHDAPDHPQTAEDVHAALGTELHRLARHVEDDFLLEVWSSTAGSVARRDGILDGPR
jgi:SAM-dependent methyltransferase